MFESLQTISTFAHEYVLMLPQLLSERGNVSFVNKYYCVGHSWTERNSQGEFLPSELDVSIFAEWLNEENEDEGQANNTHSFI